MFNLQEKLAEQLCSLYTLCVGSELGQKRGVREECLLGRLQPGLPVEHSGRYINQTVTDASLTLRRTLQAKDFIGNVVIYVFLIFVNCCARHFT